MGQMLTRKTVDVTVKGRLARVEFNRPETLNAWNEQMLKDLLIIVEQLSDMDEVDIVVFTGKGKAFSSGGDIKAMLSIETGFLQMMDTINELVMKMYMMPKLTISAINGPAAGLGLSIALATDYLIAEKDAKIAMNFIGIGLIPDGGGHFFLERRLGENGAKQLIWEGKVHTGAEALAANLIDEVAEGTLEDRVEAKITDWLNKPVLAMIKTKQIYTKNNKEKLLAIFAEEKSGQSKMRTTKDHLEGIQSFVEKRRPIFQGK